MDNGEKVIKHLYAVECVFILATFAILHLETPA